jgi:diguanylate cyclase
MYLPDRRIIRVLSQLENYVLSHEDWLTEQILKYAKERNYTEYTSTLKEAWRLSINGLSTSLIEALKTRGHDFELGPNEDYSKDPASQFGIIEAKRHRERGISLDMFLGLMKYYRQSYSDLIRESDFNTDLKNKYEQIIKRFFDRVEIGFCVEWSSAKEKGIVKVLQKNNRDMTNEKNRYLTIFESLSIPIFIVTVGGIISNMNYTASKMLNYNNTPGSNYYGKDETDKLVFVEAFPWLKRLLTNFNKSDKNKVSTEKTISNKEKYFFISFSRFLDVSGKFSDTIIVIEDITKRKIMEKDLEILATTDPLTGAKNRRSFLNLFKSELSRSKRYNYNFALLMMDIDHFKKINDTYGHDIGDKVIKLLVAESHSILRSSDSFGRWGGEEFIMLFPETDHHQATVVAERLRGALAKSELVTDNGTILNFTVSIGFTIVEDKNILVDDIIKKADDALFVAKEQGRNRVVLL